jgi:hypothetical protein
MFHSGRLEARLVRTLLHYWLLLITLDDLRAPDVGAAWIASCFAQRASLPQEVPTLVERDLNTGQALSVGLTGGTGRLALPQLVLLGDELLDLGVNLRVLHRASRFEMSLSLPDLVAPPQTANVTGTER